MDLTKYICREFFPAGMSSLSWVFFENGNVVKKSSIVRVLTQPSTVFGDLIEEVPWISYCIEGLNRASVGGEGAKKMLNDRQFANFC